MAPPHLRVKQEIELPKKTLCFLFLETNLKVAQRVEECV